MACMHEASDEDKLAILLGHWIEHNDGHAREFQDWGQRARRSGRLAVSENIMRAAEQLKKANEFLLTASDELKGE
jgi:hypothetical protein